MDFSNLFFLYLFLPLCVGIYFLAPGMKLRNGILILFSLLFYCIDRPIYLPMLLILSGINYILPKIFRQRKILALISGLVINVGILVFFKIQTSNPFPLGISFYIFSLISYGVDVYRNPEEQSESIWQFLLFVSFFPKMVMGPITRYSQLSSQFKERFVEPKDVFCGSLRFVIGLSKKVLLADPIFRIYEQLGTHTTWLSSWAAGLAFMLYIYLEFSGCCDMALGMGRIFGFRLPENFNRPYTASSVGQYWRRWHITLGSFFKEYVYIPLGGNRRGLLRQICNLLVVWVLTALWHGGTLTFLLWGLYFFTILSFEKLFHYGKKESLLCLRRMATFFFAYFGWIIFAAEDVSSLGRTLLQMFSFSAQGLDPTFLVLTNSLLVGTVGMIVAIPRPVLKDKFQSWMEKQDASLQKWIVVGQGILMMLLFAMCTVSLIGSAARPSMYAGF